MLQWGRASPDQCGQGGRSGHPVPGLGTSRLLGQGTWFGVQMGILVSQGPQGLACWGTQNCPPNGRSNGLGVTQPTAPLCQSFTFLPGQTCKDS